MLNTPQDYFIKFKRPFNKYYTSLTQSHTPINLLLSESPFMSFVVISCRQLIIYFFSFNFMTCSLRVQFSQMQLNVCNAYIMIWKYYNEEICNRRFWMIVRKNNNKIVKGNQKKKRHEPNTDEKIYNLYRKQCAYVSILLFRCIGSGK